MSLSLVAGLVLMVGMFAAAADARGAGWVPRRGIEVSGSYSTMTRSAEDSGLEVLGAKYGVGWSVGATAEWRLAPHWGLVSGLRYVEAGESQTITVSVSGPGGAFTMRGALRDTWQWLAVPLRARVTPWALPLSLEAGPEIQVLLVAKSHLDLEDVAQATSRTSPRALGIRPGPASRIFEEVGTFGGDRDVTHLYRRANLVLGGGMSFAWPVGSGRVVAHARGGFGLTDLMKSDDIARRTRVVEVGAGWQW